MHLFRPGNREYGDWCFEPHLDAPPDPVHSKLLVGDAVAEDGCVDRCSGYRRNRSIPGVLCLSRGSHGRRSGRQMFRCVPADRQLPVFLVAYTQKRAAFNKTPSDLYILFEFVEWTDKHPIGSSTNTLGLVSDLEVTYAYLLHARGLHCPIQRFTRRAFNAIREITGGARGLEDELEAVAASITRLLPAGGRHLVTIDPEGATDLDDALGACVADQGGFHVAVCITDPSYWLERLDLWDAVTQRTTTIYLPDGKRPMLPGACLSDGLCSLIAGKTRPCLVFWLRLDREGRESDSGFTWGSARVHVNCTYDDADSRASPHLAALTAATHAAQAQLPLLDDIADNHGVVAYWMLRFNLAAAAILENAGMGIYRSAPAAGPATAPVGVPAETVRISQHWGAGGGKYTSWEDRAPHAAIGDGSACYVQATSPVRRIADLVNTIRLIQTLGLRRLPAGAVRFADLWTARVPRIQEAAVGARRLQSECELLERCVRAKAEGEARFAGYPIAAEPSCPTTYVVHIPALRHLIRLQAEGEWPLFQKRMFSLHLFMDEATMHRKVRVTA
jgi:exoribonuclease R